jgi:GDP-4-dehydro-6-deoxy-D-mannose reductase
LARLLVTGCGGFVGRTLVARLAAAGHEVWGVDRSSGEDDFAGRERRVADITDGDAVGRLLEECTPDAIVHLAALSSVRASFDDPFTTLVSNTLPALHILEHLKRTARRCRALMVGSAEEYGVVAPEHLPISESAPVDPRSPYALSKSIQNQCCRAFATLYGMDVVMTRSFNHTGPGQSDAFVLSSFARQLVEIQMGRREATMHVGNLDVRRDFLDVRDVCAAYERLLEKGSAGETYNVCSGTSHRIGDLLERLRALAGVKVDVRLDPARLRPVDMPELRGSAGKLADHTGWEPTVPIDETLRALLDDWRERLAAEPGAGAEGRRTQ